MIFSCFLNNLIIRICYNQIKNRKIKKGNRIKKEYADNRQGYASIKDPFIEQTIKQALEEWNLEPVGQDYKL